MHVLRESRSHDTEYPIEGFYLQMCPNGITIPFIPIDMCTILLGVYVIQMSKFLTDCE